MSKSEEIILIKKSNDLIESHYSLSIWEARILLSLLGKIRMEDDGNEKYRLYWSEIVKWFKLKSGSSYDLLREGVISLSNKTIIVNRITEDGVLRSIHASIFSLVDVLAKDGNSGISMNLLKKNEYIDVQINEAMRPYLLQLKKNFTSYKLSNVVDLTFNSLRIYELLKQYEKIGKRRLSIDELRNMLKLGEKYEKFGDLSRWVIKPSIKQINESTDLKVNKVTNEKIGRRVTSILFEFRSKERVIKTRKLGEYEGSNISKELKDYLAKYGIYLSDKQISQISKKYLKEHIDIAVRVTKRASLNKDLKNKSGFFIKALEEGYMDEKEIRLLERLKREDKEREVMLDFQNKVKELIQADESILDNAILRIFENRDYKKYLKKIEAGLKRKLVKEDFREDLELRRLVRYEVYRMYPEEFKGIKTS
jgi:plasmid replication initiation protein